MERKNKQDDLTALIKALNGNESGYFVKYAQRRGLEARNDYLWLFQKVRAQRKVNWGQIEEEIPKGKFKIGLTKAKRVLYNHILKSMALYAAESTVDNKIRWGLTSTDFLLDKDLLPQAKKQLDRLKKLALEHDRYHLLLAVRLKEWELILKGLLKENIDKFYKQQQHYFKVTQNVEFVSFHVNKLNKLFREYNTRKSKKTAAQIEERVAILRKIPFSSLSFSSKQNVLITSSSYEMMINGDLKKANGYLETGFSLYYERKHFIQVNPFNFLNLFYFYSVNVLILRDFASLNTLMKKIEPISIDNSIAQAYKTALAYLLEINMYLKQDKLQEVKKVVSEANAFLEQEQPLAIQKIINYLQLSIVLFYYRCKQYESVINELNLIFIGNVKLVSPLMKTAYFLLCAACDKLRDELLLENTISRFEYFLRERKDLIGFDKVLITTCRLFLKSPTEKDKFTKQWTRYKKLEQTKVDIAYALFDLDKIIQEQTSA